MRNHCSDALYMPIDDALFPPGAAPPGTEIEVIPGNTLSYDVRTDKAVASSEARQDYVIHARVGGQAITLSFSVLRE